MALRALARCCSHPKGSGWQSLQCQAGLGVSAEWHSGTRPWLFGGVFSSLAVGVFTTSPQKCQYQSPWLWPSCFPKVLMLSPVAGLTQGTCTPPKDDSKDIVPRDLLLSHIRASRKILLYLIFLGKSSHKFQGERLYFDSYFRLSAFTWFRKPIPSRASSSESCSLTAAWACCLL